MERDKFVSKEGKEIAVTADGSLGLLAMGYRGLIAWREKRMEEQKEQQSAAVRSNKDPLPDSNLQAPTSNL